MQAIDAGDFEIERRLESYARARLSPDPLVIARVRARVMREARLQADLPRISVLIAPRARSGRVAPRRLAITFLAAALWLGAAAGAAFASQAGGLLYPTRMWIEQATLPTDAAARASAEIVRLDARLAEALAAAARGDAGAVAAALGAYRAITDETLVAAAGDAGLEALVATALDKHLAVLADVATRLTAKGNTIAATAVAASVERAIDRNRDVIDRVRTVTPGSGSGGSGGSGGGAGTPAGPGTGADSGAGGAEPTAEPSPKATKAPRPTAESTVPPTQVTTPNKPTPDANATPKPTAEPTVRPTPRATKPAPPQHSPRATGSD